MIKNVRENQILTHITILILVLGANLKFREEGRVGKDTVARIKMCL